MDGSSRQPKKRHPKTYFSLEKRTICQDISSTSQKKYLEQLCQKKKDLVTNLSDLRVKLSYVVPERYVPPTYKSHWDFVLDEMVLIFLSQAMNRNSCTRMSTKNESGRFMLPIVSHTKLNSTCAKREKKNAIPKKKYLSIHK